MRKRSMARPVEPTRERGGPGIANLARSVERFAAATVGVPGKSERSVQRAAGHGEKIKSTMERN